MRAQDLGGGYNNDTARCTIIDYVTQLGDTATSCKESFTGWTDCNGGTWNGNRGGRISEFTRRMEIHQKRANVLHACSGSLSEFGAVAF